MDYSQFSYPNHETPLLQAYNSRFGAAFIALHPFFRMPTSVDWRAVGSDPDYPDCALIRQHGQPVHWQTIMQGIGCEDLRRFYIGMRTSICALRQEYEDKEMTELICEYTEQLDIYHPTEGMLEELLVEPISHYISHAEANEILYLQEFKEEPEELSAAALILECDNRLLWGSFFDPNVTRLATVDWDDFFTVIYGSKDELASWLENKPLEGFFCNDQTLHKWCWQDKPVELAA